MSVRLSEILTLEAVRSQQSKVASSSGGACDYGIPNASIGMSSIDRTLLLALNDLIPDGTDVYWIWDVDTELIVKEELGKRSPPSSTSRAMAKPFTSCPPTLPCWKCDKLSQTGKSCKLQRVFLQIGINCAQMTKTNGDCLAVGLSR